MSVKGEGLSRRGAKSTRYIHLDQPEKLVVAQNIASRQYMAIDFSDTSALDRTSETN
jgi:hypothetical protein